MTVRAQEIFTPGAFPTYTYVDREEERLEGQLRDGLSTPGQVVALSGPSKSGKTVLVEKVVGRELLITVPGAGIKDPDDIWDRAPDWMDVPRIDWDEQKQILDIPDPYLLFSSLVGTTF